MKDKYMAFMLMSGQLSHFNTLKMNEDILDAEVLNNGAVVKNVFLSE